MRRASEVDPAVVRRAVWASAREFGVAQRDVRSGTRGCAKAALARRVAYMAVKNATDASWSAVGRAFGRDRKTVRGGCASLLLWIAEPRDLSAMSELARRVNQVAAETKRIAAGAAD